MNFLFTIRTMIVPSAPSTRLISSMLQSESIVKNVFSKHRCYSKQHYLSGLLLSKHSIGNDNGSNRMPFSNRSSGSANPLTDIQKRTIISISGNCLSGIRYISGSTCYSQMNKKTNGTGTSNKGDAEKPVDWKPTECELEQPLGIVAKFKLMYKQYWYVLVPVHVITSVGWMVGFYYLSKSGVDIPSLLETINVSESIIDKLKNSNMGHLAIAYVCYKLVTPLRYMVTVGGTTVSIKYLSQLGYIRPIPSKEQFRKMYDDRKAQIKRGYEELQDKRASAKEANK